MGKTFPIGKIYDNSHAFYCIPCRKSDSCSHMEIGDVKEYCNGLIHKKNEGAIKMTRKITSFSSESGAVSSQE